MIIIWKTYKESPRATFMSAMGTAAISIGISFMPAALIVAAELGFHYKTLPFWGLTGVPLFVGVLLKLFAPKQAKRDMDKHIIEDVEYARYLVQVNPELKEYICNLQHAYYEDPSRPIKNYDKSSQFRQVPLWRKVLGILLAIALLLVLIFITQNT